MTKSLAERIGASPPVLALSVARLADAVGNSILFIVLPLYVAQLPSHFAIPESVRVGVLISLYGLVNTACQPLMGALTDRLGVRKPLIQVGLLLMAAATLSFMAAGTYAQLVVLRAAQGIAVAVTIPAALALMAAITTKETRGGAMGVYSTTRMIGFAIGPLVGGVVYEHLGFDATFITGAAFLVLGFLMVQLWVQDVRTPPATGPVTNRFRIVDRTLLTGGALGAGFATFVMAADFSMLSALENQFNARLEQTAIGFAVAFSAVMVSRLLFQIPLGRLSDHIGRRPLIVMGLLLLAPSTALLGVAATTAQLTGLRLVQGLASAGVAAPAFALVADQSRAGGEGRQMAIVTMGFGLGLALGPLLGGLLAVLFFELPFLTAGIATVIAALIVHRYVPETVTPRCKTPLHAVARRPRLPGAMNKPKSGRSVERRKRPRTSRQHRATGIVQTVLRDPGAAADMLIQDVKDGADPQVVYGLLEAAQSIFELRGLDRARQLHAVRSRIERYVATGRE